MVVIKGPDLAAGRPHWGPATNLQTLATEQKSQETDQSERHAPVGKLVEKPSFGSKEKISKATKGMMICPRMTGFHVSEGQAWVRALTGGCLPA